MTNIIKNTFQLNQTLMWIDRFKEEAAALRVHQGLMDDETLRRVRLDACMSEIEALERQVVDYTRMLDGSYPYPDFSSVRTLGDDLIIARIIAKMSQKRLGELFGFRGQGQIQKYERLRYRNADLAVVMQIAAILEAENPGVSEGSPDEPD